MPMGRSPVVLRTAIVWVDLREASSSSATGGWCTSLCGGLNLSLASRQGILEGSFNGLWPHQAAAQLLLWRIKNKFDVILVAVARRAYGPLIGGSGVLNKYY